MSQKPPKTFTIIKCPSAFLCVGNTFTFLEQIQDEVYIFYYPISGGLCFSMMETLVLDNLLQWNQQPGNWQKNLCWKDFVLLI